MIFRFIDLSIKYFLVVGKLKKIYFSTVHQKTGRIKQRNKHKKKNILSPYILTS